MPFCQQSLAGGQTGGVTSILPMSARSNQVSYHEFLLNQGQIKGFRDGNPDNNWLSWRWVFVCICPPIELLEDICSYV